MSDSVTVAQTAEIALGELKLVDIARDGVVVINLGPSSVARKD